MENNTNYKIEYNEEQLQFIHSPLENSKLLGIPGGGKTSSIIGKIVYHYNNRELSAKDQFLILTFSRRACNDFIEKGRKQNKILFTNRNIKTIHSLAGKIVYHILEKNSSSQDTIMISAIDLIDTHPEEIKEINELKYLKILMVDEAQDISFIQYKLIMKIGELINCPVILIGDPNQNIYQFQNGSDQYLLNHPGNTFSLIKNYRSTPNIVSFINCFRPWESLTPEMISSKDVNHHFNRKPVVFNGTVNDVIQDVIEKILVSPFPKEEIAIIGPVKNSKQTYDSYTNIALSLFIKSLDDYGIKYIKHYEETKNDEEITTDVKRVKDYINLMTIHGSKGLEFHQVFLINFHTSTFGIIPSEEKYREFKYLWYVGLSRSAYDLNIYVDKNKLVWNELKSCPKELYETNIKKQPFMKELKFNEEIQPINHSINDILNSKKMINDETIFNLENMLKYKINVIPIFNDYEANNITNYNEYSVLYDMYIDNIFQYYFIKKIDTSRYPDYINNLVKMLNNKIIIPKNLLNGYKLLKIRYPHIKNNAVKLLEFSLIKNIFKKPEEELYSYLCNVLNNNYNKEFFLSNNDEIDLTKIIKEIKDGINIHNNIFKITLYNYQLINEISNLWNNNFENALEEMEYNIIKIKEYINNNVFGFENNFEIHTIVKHQKLDIIGDIDILTENKIIDISFSDNINIKHILQLIFYNNIVEPSFKKEYQLEIWNFQLGNKYIIEINREEIDRFQFLKTLSRAICKKIKNMIFLYDLKTTGGTYTNKKIEIIERHIEELTTGIVISTGLLKPTGVPFIPFELTKSTGITKDNVYENGQVYEIFQQDISQMFNYCYKPILITHNSNNNKIMLEKKLITYDNCKLLDSRMIIKLFLLETISDKNISDIYHFIFKTKPSYNRAYLEIDMLKQIFDKLNITKEKILKM